MSHHQSEKELRGLHAALETERKTLEKELGEHGRKIGDDWQGSATGPNEPDAIDEADKLEELATNVPLVEELERRYREVVDALNKMKDGSYGVDEETGEPIALERLRANPAARTNI